jgi:glycosyltransferase involved in cell wall biosynthesis
MKVLLVTPMPPDPAAASAIPVLLHAQLVGLRERHDVTLVTLAGPDPAEIEAVDRLDREGVDIHPTVRALTRGTLGWRRRVRIVSTWLRGRVPLRTAWFAEPEIQTTIDALVVERQFDVVVVEDNAMAAFRLPPGLPSVLTEHEVRRRRKIKGPPREVRAWPAWAFNEADWRRWPSYQRRVWSRFDALQVFTQRDAEAVATLAPELARRVRVNPFAIELPASNDVEEEPDTMVFAGNYTHLPNVDAAIWLARDILPRIAHLHPRVELSIVGPYAPPEVRSLDGPHLRFLGLVPDLEALLRRTAIVMAPVRTGGGMRMKVLHAMALGRPVVTTPRGAEGLAAGGAALPLDIGGDADALAHAAVGLLQDRDARRDLGSRARSYVQAHHSPQAYVDRFDRVLAAILPERNPPNAREDSHAES